MFKKHSNFAKLVVWWNFTYVSEMVLTQPIETMTVKGKNKRIMLRRSSSAWREGEQDHVWVRLWNRRRHSTSICPVHCVTGESRFLVSLWGDCSSLITIPVNLRFPVFIALASIVHAWSTRGGFVPPFPAMLFVFEEPILTKSCLLIAIY